MEEEEEKEMATPTPQLPFSAQQTLNRFPEINHKEPLETKIMRTHKRPPHLDNIYQPVTEIPVVPKTKRQKQKRAVNRDVCEPAIANSAAMEEAEKIRANLDAKFPSFVKTMVLSNVSRAFWLHMPMPFCKLHLIASDTTLILEDENGEEYATNYLVKRTALSAGWRRFSTAHNLLEGDVLVFQLIGPTKFKVYIVRGGVLDKTEHGVEKLNSKSVDADQKQKDQAKKDIKSRSKVKDRVKKDTKNHPKVECFKLQLEKNSLKKLSDANMGHIGDQCGNGNELLSSDAMEGIRNSVSKVDFEKVESIDSFIIQVNGFTIDSKLSENCREKYYELCRSQKSFLHDNLLKNINYNLAAEIVTETINIAEAIRTCKPCTSEEDYVTWDRTLKGFELLGMNVGFLRDRLNRLMSLALESEEYNRYREALFEEAQAEEEIKDLEAKVLKLKEKRESVVVEMEELKMNAVNHELMLQEEINNVPW